jgi:hypothetical protein
MKIFNAAVWTNNYAPGQNKHGELEEHEQQKVADAVKGPILESYHYIKKGRYADEIRNGGGKIFLDSGAFSAFTLGVEIPISEYCNFIHANDDIILRDDGILMAAGMDSIGNEYETFHNLDKMWKLGVKALPTFHAGEDEKFLELYIKHYPYILLGGMVGGSQLQLMNWLDRVWSNNLTDGSGNPRLKVHGFGITSDKLIERYPWYSVDSSLWIQSASFGMIVTKKYRNITVSTNSPARHTRGAHLANMSNEEQKAILKIIDDAGFNFERLSESYQSRVSYNLWSMGEIMKVHNKKGCNMDFMSVQELF